MIPGRRAGQPTPVFLPGESPWTEEPGRLQSMESQRVTHDGSTKHKKHSTVQVGLRCPGSDSADLDRGWLV